MPSRSTRSIRREAGRAQTHSGVQKHLTRTTQARNKHTTHCGNGTIKNTPSSVSQAQRRESASDKLAGENTITNTRRRTEEDAELVGGGVTDGGGGDGELRDGMDGHWAAQVGVRDCPRHALATESPRLALRIGCAASGQDAQGERGMRDGGGRTLGGVNDKARLRPSGQDITRGKIPDDASSRHSLSRAAHLASAPPRTCPPRDLRLMSKLFDKVKGATGSESEKAVIEATLHTAREPPPEKYVRRTSPSHRTDGCSAARPRSH